MLQARIAIDKYAAVADVDPRLYGSFIEHLGRAVYEGIYQPEHPLADEEGFRTDALDLIRPLQVPVVRYPGGNFVSGYRWEDGVGPKELRPKRLDYAWSVVESNQFGLNEFMSWCKKAGTEPMMAINLGTRGAAEAMDLLEYCNHPSGTAMSDLRISHGVKDPYNIRLWCLGNEMDGPWQIGHKTAREYGRLAAEVGSIMRRYDPELELVVCGSSKNILPTFGEWEREVLMESYDIADYISMHMYWKNLQRDTACHLASSREMDRFIQSVISACDFVQTVKRSPKKVNLSFDEWNVWYHSRGIPFERWSEHPHQLEDVYNFEDALVVGTALITMLRHADRVKIACLAQLINVIAPIMTSDTGIWKQTIYYPFLHASTMGRGRVLHTTVLCDTYDCAVEEQVPYLDAVVTEDGEEATLTVFAVNKSLTDSMELVCDLRQYADYRVVEHLVLEHENMMATNTEVHPDEVVPHGGGVSRNDGGHFTALLNAHSWNVIRLKKQ